MTEIKKDQKITIAGAGLAGCLMACYLAKQNFTNVTVYERRSDMRKDLSTEGRSINLALSERGLVALKEIGMDDFLNEVAIPMTGRMIHSVEGELNYQPYSSSGKLAINSVSRSGLNRVLMNKAEQLGVNLIFDKKCSGINYKTGELTFIDHQEKMEKITSDFTIASDGAFSQIRASMLQSLNSPINYSQEFLSHGYKELTIPATKEGGFQMEKNCLHIWPRGTYMMIALANPDGSFTCTLFFPMKGPNSFETLKTEKQVEDFFKENFADSIPLMPTLVQDWFKNSCSGLVTLRTNPWSIGEKVLLIGDAAHAIVPFFGQGMNCAFEDCTVFNQCLNNNKTWIDLLNEYNPARVDNANAIANMALENFIEMRDSTANEQFKLRKNIEHSLEREFPDIYTARYELVSFSTTEYKECYRIGEQNDKILEEIMKTVDSIEKLDLQEAKKIIQKYRD